MYDGVIVNNADSANEDIKEMPIAILTKPISNITLVVVGCVIISSANAGKGKKAIANKDSAVIEARCP